MNKRRQRTQALMQATARRRIAEQADNAIEQHNFDRLVRSGVIVEDEDNTDTYELEYPDWAGRTKSMLISEAGARGKAGGGCL